MQYLTRLRMQVAHERARATDEPLAALASHVGYQSEAAFCRAFKRMFGVSPGSLRTAHRWRGNPSHYSAGAGCAALAAGAAGAVPWPHRRCSSSLWK